MNRIILLGNGFDLAHDLRTSYKHFIDNFWANASKKYFNKNSFTFSNDYISIEIPPLKRHDELIKPKESDIFDYKTFSNFLHQNGRLEIKFKNHFLEIITKNLSFKDWVDIEEEYYQQIKNIVQNELQPYKKKEIMRKLNEEFEKIKEELEKYLSEITSKNIAEIDKMFHIFYAGFELEDFPKSKENLLLEYIAAIIYKCDDMYKYRELREEAIEHIIRNYKIDDSEIKIKHIIEYIKLKLDNLFSNNRDKFYPQNTLILNFNYTNTESLYSKYGDVKRDFPKLPFHSIHIHGELNNKENPIIFGYGDELADEYKEIEKLGDPEYFRNIKSIKYLKTGNYRKLLNFIDSDYYQVFTLGHSCGNSDRTLLNTLFEHENCVSIKPFFYEKEENGEKTDDYENITINMSRNFNDKKAFREKVVNRTRCTSLPQIQK
jgi:hypothetical protein